MSGQPKPPGGTPCTGLSLKVWEALLGDPAKVGAPGGEATPQSAKTIVKRLAEEEAERVRRERGE